VKVIKDISENIIKDGLGIGLGNFDGLHIGHMSLISALLDECKTRRINSMLYTFDNHTENILSDKIDTPQIITMEKKIELLSKTQIDYIYLENFNKEYASMTPEKFVEEILIKKLNAKFVVIGFNYTFGNKSSGNTDLMKKLGREYKFDVIEISPIKMGREIISSTLIRKLVKKGDVNKARLCTGRYYSIYGLVQMGRQIGTTLGFPTANIMPEEYLVLPKSGVYVTKTVLDGEIYNSITNIGNNPTFGNTNKTSCETHIFGREGNLYGKRIEVFFMAKLRGEIKFESKDELCRQINADIVAAREFFRTCE